MEKDVKLRTEGSNYRIAEKSERTKEGVKRGNRISNVQQGKKNCSDTPEGISNLRGLDGLASYNTLVLYA
jgi:hypothetical protein